MVPSALFIVADGHPSRVMLHEQGLEIDPGDDLILRRVLGTDGRSRAFVNDQAVSVGLLRRVGESLVEVHGQFDNQRLMSPTAHRTILDAFGGLAADVAGTAAAYEEWRDLAAARSAAAEAFAAAQRKICVTRSRNWKLWPPSTARKLRWPSAAKRSCTARN